MPLVLLSLNCTFVCYPLDANEDRTKREREGNTRSRKASLGLTELSKNGGKTKKEEGPSLCVCVCDCVAMTYSKNLITTLGRIFALLR